MSSRTVDAFTRTTGRPSIARFAPRRTLGDLLSKAWMEGAVPIFLALLLGFAVILTTPQILSGGDRGIILAGDPESCIKGVQLYEEAGVDQVILITQTETIPPSIVLITIGSTLLLAVAERLRDNVAKQELLEVENRLQSFFEMNRDIGTSPLLRFRQDRLQREVDIRQAVVSALAQNFEQARIDEVRDIPVITIVEEPEVPALPDPRMLLLRGVLALVAGAMLGALIAFFLAFVRASRTDAADELDEFRRLKRAAALDIRRPWRLLGFGRG